MRRRHLSRASTARCTTWRGSITAVAWRISSAVAVVNPYISMISKPLHQEAVCTDSHVCRTCLDRPSTTPRSRAGPLRRRRQIDDHVDVLIPPGNVAPPALVQADELHVSQADRGVDRQACALGQNRVVGGAPGTPRSAETRLMLTWSRTSASGAQRIALRESLDFAGPPRWRPT